MWRPADIERALAQPRTLRECRHRPWPLPDRPWVMGQTWEDLLFMHWPVDPDELRAAVPPQIPIDTFEGHAWVGVTPFTVTGMHPRLTLPLPYTARFPELNVRTYATIDGRPGIWFFSLDTPNRAAVAAARRIYRLPYFRSQIAVRHDGDRVRFAARRTSGDAPPASIALEYAPSGPRYTAERGSFEEFATERYCLYTLNDRGEVLRGDIHHPPWPLRQAEATVAGNAMGKELGIALDGEPRLHFAGRQDVVFWLNERA